MDIITAYSCKSNGVEAINEIKSKFGSFNTNTLIYFTSSNYDQDEVAQEFQKAFSKSTVFGCSTSGEIVSGKMLKNSIVAMAFNENVVADVKVEVLENISEHISIEDTFGKLGKHFGVNVGDMSYKEYFGIVLCDGMSGKEEKILERVSDLSNITFIGGSAGDDLKFQRTWLHYNGKAYNNAALIALFKSKKSFDIIKTQSFKTLGKQLVATKVNEQTREVYEFNKNIAAQEYANYFKMPVSEISTKFMSNPVGLVINRDKNDVFVRSPQMSNGESIKFYCNILEGMEVEILESTNIVEDTRKAVMDKQAALGKIEGIINFHCILRTLELENKNQTQSYGEIFTNIPTIGFSTYGEAYYGHINQTSTMLVFY